MADPIDVLDTLVQFAADVGGEPGDFSTIENLTGISPDHSSEDPTETRVFGKSAAFSRGGELSHTYSADGLWTPTDTNGQAALWAAYKNKTLGWIKYLPNGSTGFQQQVRVVGVSQPSEADGDYVEASFELRGVPGTLEDATLET